MGWGVGVDGRRGGGGGESGGAGWRGKGAGWRGQVGGGRGQGATPSQEDGESQTSRSTTHPSIYQPLSPVLQRTPLYTLASNPPTPPTYVPIHYFIHHYHPYRSLYIPLCCKYRVYPGFKHTQRPTHLHAPHKPLSPVLYVPQRTHLSTLGSNTMTCRWHCSTMPR